MKPNSANSLSRRSSRNSLTVESITPPETRSKSLSPPGRNISKTPSKKPRRSRSKSISKSHRRSISKSPRRSISKSPRRSISKTPRRSISKSPVKGESLKQNKSRSRRKSKSVSRSKSRSKSPGGNKLKSPVKPKLKKVLKKKKRKVIRKMPRPKDEEVEKAVRDAESEDYKGISRIILRGDGYRLVGAKSNNEEVQGFLNGLPDSLVCFHLVCRSSYLYS